MKSPRTDIPHHYMYDNLQMVQQYILHLGTPVDIELLRERSREMILYLT